MKKIIFSIMFLLSVVKSFTQTQTGSAHSKEYYLQKSKNQKTIAWILLGAGTTSMVVGLIEGSQAPDNLDNLTKGVAPVLIGLAADLASIPFFISSSKNKKIASFVTINNQKILLPQQSSLCLKIQPAITLKINL
jgi:hypothetical protein